MSKNLKLKKVIKSFVPEPISSIFGFLYVYEHYERFIHVNILVIFLDRYVKLFPKYFLHDLGPSSGMCIL